LFGGKRYNMSTGQPILMPDCREILQQTLKNLEKSPTYEKVRIYRES